MSFNAMGIFDKLQQREQQRASEGNGGSFGNKNILKLQRGSKYQLRLLYLPPMNCDRMYPMINSYSHSFWDDNASGNKMKVVACPTSQYLDGDRGFDNCVICACASAYYKESTESHSKTASELYKKFKRNFNGYIPVYVVNGPEDVVGKVMILRYGKQLADFLNLKVFGVAPKTRKGENPIEVDADDVLGISAFTYIDDDGNIVNKAYDLTITVTTKSIPTDDGKNVDVPNYAFDFKRNQTTITEFNDVELTAEYFNTLNEELSFDKDFYINSSAADRENFKLKYITAGEDIDSSTGNGDKESALPQPKPLVKKPAQTVISDEVEQPAPKVKPASPKTEIAEDDFTDENGEIDVDKLLDNI